MLIIKDIEVLLVLQKYQNNTTTKPLNNKNNESNATL